MPLPRDGVPIWKINRFIFRAPGLHINCLELKVLMLAQHHWVPVLKGHQVMVAVDNSTVMSYINKWGNTLPLSASSNSGPIPVASLRGHRSQSQTHPRLTETLLLTLYIVIETMWIIMILILFVPRRDNW